MNEAMGVGVRPHSARMYDYYLGGKTNYGIDREAAVKALRAFPNTLTAARENREFMHRAVRFLGRERNIRQFLDIGTGIPTAPNLHQVAQRQHPDARVVYADNDPIVLAHARALMNSSAEGRTDYVQADVRDAEKILDQARHTLDFDRPIAVSLIALMHFITDRDDPYGIVRTLLDALPPGSALALSHATDELDPTLRRVVEVYEEQGIDAVLRSAAETREFFTGCGFDLVEPGLTATCDWRPDLLDDDSPGRLQGSLAAAEVGVWAGVGIKSVA